MKFKYSAKLFCLNFIENILITYLYIVKKGKSNILCKNVLTGIQMFAQKNKNIIQYQKILDKV